MTPYMQGYHAWLSTAKEISGCPYKEGTEEYAWWTNGFVDAYKDNDETETQTATSEPRNAGASLRLVRAPGSCGAATKDDV